MTQNWAKVHLRKSRPWFFPIIAWFFPKADRSRVVIAFASTIYAPSGIDAALMVHEAIHLRQQRFSKTGAVKWWVRYILSPKFRVEQEMEAYRGQYRELKKLVKDRNKLARYATYLAEDLTGGMYGATGLSMLEAREKIQAYWA